MRALPDPDVRDMPAAALTAFARSEDRTKALQSGFEMHLAKPVDPGELVASVATLVRRRADGDAMSRTCRTVNEMPKPTTTGALRLASSPAEQLNAIVFDHVSLAFDDHVVLQDLSFTVPKGDMRILFGASGAGKSVILKLALGLLRPDAGTILVNGMRVDQMPEHELLKMRSDIGMVFQENALFDSLTVAQNVGFRLLGGARADRRTDRCAHRRGARLRRPDRIRRPHAVGAVGRAAPPRRHRARDGVEAAPAAVRRSDHRPRSADRDDDRR